VTGISGDLRITCGVSLWAGLDQVDLDYRVELPPSVKEHRLCHYFPLFATNAVVRLETPGAVIRPEPQPRGDLLSGADARRFAAQGFVSASVPGGPCLLLAPLDAFALRRDLGPVVFEALGNDQNFREVARDQGGERQFRFRYVLGALPGDYNQAAALAWSRRVATPMLATRGAIHKGQLLSGRIAVDSSRALATAVKPADDVVRGGVILRVWEMAGVSGRLAVRSSGFKQVTPTDLLERDGTPLAANPDNFEIQINPLGFASLRFSR